MELVEYTQYYFDYKNYVPLIIIELSLRNKFKTFSFNFD